MSGGRRVRIDPQSEVTMEYLVTCCGGEVCSTKDPGVAESRAKYMLESGIRNGRTHNVLVHKRRVITEPWESTTMGLEMLEIADAG